MTQDNKIRFEHIIGHFQAIAAMEMVDKSALRGRMMVGKWSINLSLAESIGRCNLCQPDVFVLWALLQFS